MKNTIKARIALLSVVVASTVILALFIMSEEFHISGEIHEYVAWIFFAVGVYGCYTGWCAFSAPLGRLAAILGTLMVVGFLFLLLRTDSSNPLDEFGKNFDGFFTSENVK